MAGIYAGLNVTPGSDYANKVFHGFRLNPETGVLTYDYNDGIDGVPVVLPDAYAVRNTDYLIYLWTTDTINFTVDPTTGHLLMEYK